MDDAKPCNKHMSFETFKSAIDFFNHYGGVELVITGGEPTDNPSFIPMIIYALKHAYGSVGGNTCHVTLATNAMNIANDHDLQKYLLIFFDKYNDKFHIQVTHDDRYYPIPVDLSSNFFKMPNVIICKEVRHIYPMGRARDNNLPWQSQCSKCFNFRSLIRTTQSIDKACITLALYNKYCTPQISIDGKLKLGESTLCPVCSDINNSHDKIVEDILNFHCNQCDIINKNLTIEQKQAIGE
jgi:hypothetical protein